MLLAILLAPGLMFAQARHRSKGQVSEPTATLTGMLKGKLLNQPIRKVYLQTLQKGEYKTDSASVLKGIYHFSIRTADPKQAILYINGIDVNNRPTKIGLRLFVEPGKITIVHEDSFPNVKISGSKTEIEYELVKAQTADLEKTMQNEYNNYMQARQQGDTTALKNAEMKIDSLFDQETQVYGDYAKNNPTSSFAIFALENYSGSYLDPDKIEPIFNKFSTKIKTSEEGRELKHRLDLAKASTVGKFALDFELPDTLGHPIKLSSFRGKYTLLDFWASWCGPCRAENPNVVKVFNKYKEKGFTILSVSLDSKDGKQKWIDAIHKDQLTWTHVSDLNSWSNKAAKLYGIQAIPSNFLIDPSGKIVAKNLRGEDLENKLKEIFGS